MNVLLLVFIFVLAGALTKSWPKLKIGCHTKECYASVALKQQQYMHSHMPPTEILILEQLDTTGLSILRSKIRNTFVVVMFLPYATLIVMVLHFV